MEDFDRPRSGGFRGRSSGRFGGGGRSGGFGGRGGFRGRDSGYDRERRPLEMHEATCAKCGKPCQVPFRPTGNKPVYCSACFETMGNSRSGRNGPDMSAFSEKLDKINLKLDKIMKSLNLE